MRPRTFHPGINIIIIAICKNLNRWQCSIKMKAAQPLANWLWSALESSNPGPWLITLEMKLLRPCGTKTVVTLPSSPAGRGYEHSVCIAGHISCVWDDPGVLGDLDNRDADWKTQHTVHSQWHRVLWHKYHSKHSPKYSNQFPKLTQCKPRISPVFTWRFWHNWRDSWTFKTA